MTVKELFDVIKESVDKGNGDKHIIITHGDCSLNFAPDFIYLEDDVNIVKEYLKNPEEHLLTFYGEKVDIKDVVLLGD